MFKEKQKTKTAVLAALFLAMGMFLPLLTAQIKEIGDTLLPMHIPVMLCGLICGRRYGMVTGLLLPFLRSAMFGMPPMYPNAVWMSLELAAYGFVIGLLYSKSSKKTLSRLYFCLIASMVSGRIVWGVAKTVLLGLGGKAFTFYAFISGGILDAIPGIILQLIIIPTVMTVINKYRKEV